MQHHSVLKLTFGVALVALLLLSACSGGRRGAMLSQLETVDSLMDSHPDSALVLLNGMRTTMDGESKAVRMRYQLLRHQAMNKTYVSFTSDSLMLLVSDFYDRHGSANERMLAHYLLGCVYRDMGDAPQALSAYHDAVECADATANDCDYGLLSRLHAQMSSLLYRMQLPYEALDEAGKAEKMSVIANDSIMKLDSKMLKADAFFLLGKTDSVISISEFVSRKYLQYGDTMYSILCLKPAIVGYSNRGMLDSARKAIDTYERLLTNKSNNIIAYSKKNYHIVKANYFLQCHQYDSAYHYYHQARLSAETPEERLNVLRGFSRYFIVIGKADSALKYTDLYVLADDSVYRTSVRENFAKMQALYNYERNQRKAEQVEYQLSELQNRFMMIACIATIFIAFFIIYVRNKREKAERRWKNTISELERARQELDNLRGLESEMVSLQNLKQKLIQQIKESEYNVQRLESLVTFYEQSSLLTKRNVENSLDESGLYKSLCKRSYAGRELTEEDWDDIQCLLDSTLPGFYTFIVARRHQLTLAEYRMCILFRLHFDMKVAAGFLGLSKATISRNSSIVLKKIFGEEGSGKKLKSILEIIS